MRPSALVLALVVLPGALAAQTVPETSPASRVQQSYRRTPSFRNDPFRHVAIPHWGFVFGGGLTAANNTLNAEDIGAIILLGRNDSMTVGNAVDIIGLVPQGTGLRGSAQAEGGAYLGGPFGSHFSFGLSGRGTGYGGFQLDDDAVALFRDGNGTRQDFSLGSSKGTGLATAEAGAHAIIRLSPMGSVDGAQVSFGFGGRYIRPIFYGHGGSTLANGGILRITSDTIRANFAVEQLHSTDVGATMKGSGKAIDLMLRVEWPTSGLAFEALVANLGTVSVPGVERSSAAIDLTSTSLLDVGDAIDTTEFEVQDTTTVDVTLPRIVRFTASSWANRILQLDVSATLPVTGEFETPLAVDLGTTWRFIRTIPLRAGVILGGNQGIGFSGGIAVEGRNMFLQLGAQSLGGLFRKATGVGARFELGFFF